ncbi:thiol-disulfide oxidoreductase ResA [Staphylospora marina]|uniref:thiol-disulfide oxidoreductase ResA n=1 Tax=Staphylospora marina TaxID=2490858 RepID=UPI000F5BA5B2|nr:thiol-disulfide oxidoreductase ResA [Staphylospora marina]
MNKQTRYWVRRVLFLAMVAMIGFALYQGVFRADAAPETGSEAPDFRLRTLDGKTVSLSDFRGKGVMLNFWGTWCEPCRTEMPAMQQAYEKYGEQGFVILAVNIGETEVTAGAFARQYGLTFPILMDSDRNVTKRYKIGPIPSTFFIAPDGTIKRVFQGPVKLEQLEGYVREILPGR